MYVGTAVSICSQRSAGQVRLVHVSALRFVLNQSTLQVSSSVCATEETVSCYKLTLPSVWVATLRGSGKTRKIWIASFSQRNDTSHGIFVFVGLMIISKLRN